MKLHEIEAIRYAVMLLTTDKFLRDGYVDMATVGYDDIQKTKAYSDLEQDDSRFKELFGKFYPADTGSEQSFIPNETLPEHWEKYILQTRDKEKCNYKEAKYIVSYVNYLLGHKYSPTDSSMQFWLHMFSDYIAPLVASESEYDIRIENKTVIYNYTEVHIETINKISDFLNLRVYDYAKSGHTVFYRGHSLMNYQLVPAVMRKKPDSGDDRVRYNEQRLYNEIQYKCPGDFEKCHTHLEKLTIMQHYGLPTRLLDVTTNPLVALYFACESDRFSDRLGEIVIMQTETSGIKWPSSDTVSILASMSALSFDENERLADTAMRYYPGVSYRGVFNNNADGRIGELTYELSKLLAEIEKEKHGFMFQILAKDIFRKVFVYAIHNNRRISNQSGAFLLFGESFRNPGYLIGGRNIEPANEFRVRDMEGKKLIMCIANKREIMDELYMLGVKKETLFPEIDSVSREMMKELFA